MFLLAMTATQTMICNIFYNFILLLGPIDDIDLDQFDPDGVDFEPLLVSGSKFILFFVSYYTMSFSVQAIAELQLCISHK